MKMYVVFRAGGLDVFAREKTVKGYKGFVSMIKLAGEGEDGNAFLAKEMTAMEVADLFLVETGVESVRMENEKFGKVEATRKGEALRIKGDNVEMVLKGSVERCSYGDDFFVDVTPYVE